MSATPVMGVPRVLASILVLGVGLGLPVVADAAATFSIINLDTANVGLNDATSFTPQGGNSATTLGQARLNVLAEAGRIWGQRLTSSQTILVDAQMSADTCTSTSATLASAGPATFFTDSATPSILFPAALAHALGAPDPNNRHDIRVRINSNVGTGASCLNGRSFYLGFDHVVSTNANGTTNVDLLNVLLHEFGHGLGFLSLGDSNGVQPKSPSTGASFFTGLEQYIYREDSGKFWCAMSDSERAAASIANGLLVYNGGSVNGNLGGFTAGVSAPGGHLKIYAPVVYSDGSSVSHWDTTATPNLLMEPFITANPQGLTDITGCLLRDLGWPGARCPDPAGTANRAIGFNQCVTTTPSTPVSIALSGTSGSGSGTLTYSIAAQPTKGTLRAPAIVSAPVGTAVTFVYTPNGGASGTDGFTFQVNDGVSTSVATPISIAIAAPNRAPSANAQTVSALQAQATNITLTGSDPDGDPLTYAIVANPISGTLSGVAPNLTYTSNAGFVGSDSFRFTVSDGALNSPTATVTINVAAAAATPTAVVQSVSATAGQSVSITLNGTDPASRPLTYVIVSQPANGTLTGSAPSMTYTANATFSGNDSFQFRVNNGLANSANATVSIAVTRVPTATAQTVNAVAGQSLSIVLSGADAASSALTFSIATQPASGALSGTAPNLTYLAPANFAGSDSFTFRTNNGQANSAAATIAINVTAPPPPPSSGGGGRFDIGMLGLLLVLLLCRFSARFAVWHGPSSSSLEPRKRLALR